LIIDEDGKYISDSKELAKKLTDIVHMFASYGTYLEQSHCQAYIDHLVDHIVDKAHGILSGNVH
jgi:hypothetical protein